MNNIKRVLEKRNYDATADYMVEILTDENWTTYKMFETLAKEYLNGNEDVRKGIDMACEILTGWNVESMAKNILEREIEE